MPAKAVIIYQEAKWLQSEASLADVGVAVHPAPLRLETIVEVKHLEFLQTDESVEGAEGGAIFLERPQRIPGREDVTGVEADTETLRVMDLGQDVGEMLKAVSQAGSLPGRGFKQDAHVKM